jgi:hypothetical protein
MSSELLLYAYLMAAGSAILLLAVHKAWRWYWHVLAIAVGVAAGLLPPPAGWGDNRFFLTTGTIAVFLLIWGGIGLFVPRHAA